MVLLPLSATNTLPALSTATPQGYLNRAALPVPSALPEVPARPASVVTTPAGVTFRIVQLTSSATNMLPAPSTATPVGKLSRAALPASVVTTPAGVTFRIVQLTASATNT